MVIGVDCDEVIFPLLDNHCVFLNKKYSININPRMFSSYDFWRHYGATREQAVGDFIEFTATDEFMNVSPIEGAQEGIRELRKLDELYIITSRTANIKDKTQTWLDKHFPGLFSEIYFTNVFSNGEYNRLTKRELCKNHHASLLLEDHLDYALDVSQDIPVILFDKPWNQKLQSPIPNVYKIRAWPEVLPVAKAILKK